MTKAVRRKWERENWLRDSDCHDNRRATQRSCSEAGDDPLARGMYVEAINNGTEIFSVCETLRIAASLVLDGLDVSELP